MELIATLDANTRIMNNNLVNMNQLLLTKNNTSLKIDTEPFLKRMDAANQRYKDIADRIDSLNKASNKNLSEINNSINASQYKSQPQN